MSAVSPTDPALARLVHSVLAPGFDGPSVPDWLADALDGGLGGVCWFAHNVPGVSAAADLAAEIHTHHPDVLILCDEEGGTVTRLERDDGSSWPGHAALGAVDDPALTGEVARGIGSMARRAGVDVVLSPVVDVNSDPHNPVIGVRAFGDRPGLVSRHGAAFVEGLQSQGVAACAKHFPGHGATRTDSHIGLPVVDAHRTTIMERDVAPFAAAVAAGTRCVLTAHVSFPTVDATPATMSPIWMSILRDDLGFDGLVVSDALDMEAISRGIGRSAGAVAALRAGVDLVCIGNPVFPEPYDAAAVFGYIQRAVSDAVADGTLPLARLEEAAARVAALAAWLGSARAPADPSALAPPSDAAAGRDAARRAIRVVGDVRLQPDAEPLVIVEDRVGMAGGPQRNWVVEALARRGRNAWVETVHSPDDVHALAAPWHERPAVLVTDGISGDDVIRAVHARDHDVIVVWTGTTPSSGDHHVLRGERIAVVYAYGAGRVSADAAVDALVGAS